MDTKVEQICPFCFAPWGRCSHYDVLMAWELEAAEAEPVQTMPETILEPLDHPVAAAATVAPAASTERQGIRFFLF